MPEGHLHRDDSRGATIGCVFIYPGESGADADVRSWVRADHAHLGLPLYDAVSTWVRSDWPFETVEYASREQRPQNDDQGSSMIP